jgi:hypothetical protein
MSIGTPDASVARKSVPVRSSDLEELARVRRSQPHREALARLSHEFVPEGASESRVLHALLAAGMTAVREAVEADGYAQIATQQDAAARKASARRRRPSWADE